MKSQDPKTGHILGAARPIPPPNFDTMGAMEILMKAGFAEDQASAIVGTVRDAQRELVTKADLDLAFSELKADLGLAISGLKADLGLAMSGLKTDSDLAISGLKTDSDLAISGLKADLGLAMSGLKTDSDLAISGLKAEMETVKLELQGDMKALEGKVEHQFAQLYRHLWIGTGVIISAITSILGMMLIFSGWE